MQKKNLNSLDLYILVPILLGFLIGLFRGLIKEVISIIILVSGIYFSKLLSPILAQWMVNGFDINIKAAQPLAFIIVFILVAILLVIIGKIIHKMVTGLSLGFFNSLLGGVFGGLKFALLVSVILILTDALNEKLDFMEEETKINSVLYKPIKKLAPDLWKEFQESEERRTKSEEL